jgi:hypothetical protein
MITVVPSNECEDLRVSTATILQSLVMSPVAIMPIEIVVLDSSALLSLAHRVILYLSMSGKN